MKAIMEFDLPADAWEHETATNAHTYRRALADVLETLRAKIKYGGPEDAAILPYCEGLRDSIYSNLDGAPEP